MFLFCHQNAVAAIRWHACRVAAASKTCYSRFWLTWPDGVVKGRGFQLDACLVANFAGLHHPGFILKLR